MLRLIKILPIIFCLNAGAINYYVSSSGCDGSAGTTPATAWKTITKVNSYFSLMVPGDSILFKRGETFFGSLVISRSGTSALPMIIGAYGTGAKPIITGFTAVALWTSNGDGTYTSNLAVTPLTTMNMVSFQDTLQPMGRWPKVSGGGYLTYQSHSGSTSITSDAISSALNYVGGEIVTRKKAWIIDRARVTAQTSTTVTFAPFTDAAIWPLTDGYGFFFQNHVNACTQLGEWAYDSVSRKIKMYFGAVNPLNYSVKITNLESLVTITSKSYITFDNIQFSGSNSKTFYISTSNNLEIKNCVIEFSGIDAIWCNGNAQTDNISIHDNIIRYTNNNAIDAGEGSFWTIRNNEILNTGVNAGMGVSADKTYIAIRETEDDIIIERNRIIKTGYTGIYFSGNNNLIRKNFIDSFCLIKSDGSAIYTYAETTKTNRRVISNIVTNGVGNNYGHGWTNPYDGGALGIYTDGGARNVEIDSNSVSSCSYSGFLLQSPIGVTLKQNTSFNSIVAQIDHATDNNAISTLTETGNIWFAKQASQLVVKMRLSSNYLSSLGVLDSNFYCRPINEPQGINTNEDNGQGINRIYLGSEWRWYSLDTWKTVSSQDANTVKTPIAITDVNDIRFEYNVTQVPVTIPLPFSYIDVKGNIFNGSITLQPYTSAVLIKNGASTDQTAIVNQLNNALMRIAILEAEVNLLKTKNLKATSTTITIIQ